MSKSKEFQIDWNGKKETVSIKKWSLKQRDKYLAAVNTVKMIGNSVSHTLDIEKVKTEALIRGLLKAPFPVTREYIEGDDFDAEIGDVIFKEINEFNHLDIQKK